MLFSARLWYNVSFWRKLLFVQDTVEVVTSLTLQKKFSATMCFCHFYKRKTVSYKAEQLSIRRDFFCLDKIISLTLHSLFHYISKYKRKVHNFSTHNFFCNGSHIKCVLNHLQFFFFSSLVLAYNMQKKSFL